MTGSWLWPSFDRGGFGGIGGGESPLSGQRDEKDNKSPLSDHGRGFWSEPEAVDGAPEIRMPELSSPCSSPGARQENDDNDGIPIRPPPKIRRKNSITAAEAYNKGMLLQYIITSCSEADFCNRDSTYTECYESNWEGHQPLTPTEDDTGIPASELRLMRSRRRRGVMSPPRRNERNAKIGSGDDPLCVQEDNSVVKGHYGSLNSPGSFSIAFPGDVVDPHLSGKKEWQPNFDCAAK